MLWSIRAVPPMLAISPPLSALSPQRITLLKLALEVHSALAIFTIAPPSLPAWFPEKVTLVSTGALVLALPLPLA